MSVNRKLIWRSALSIVSEKMAPDALGINVVEWESLIHEWTNDERRYGSNASRSLRS